MKQQITVIQSCTTNGEHNVAYNISWYGLVNIA